MSANLSSASLPLSLVTAFGALWPASNCADKPVAPASCDEREAAVAADGASKAALSTKRRPTTVRPPTGARAGALSAATDARRLVKTSKLRMVRSPSGVADEIWGDNERLASSGPVRVSSLSLLIAVLTSESSRSSGRTWGAGWRAPARARPPRPPPNRRR